MNEIVRTETCIAAMKALITIYKKHRRDVEANRLRQRLFEVENFLAELYEKELEGIEKATHDALEDIIKDPLNIEEGDDD